MDFLYAIFIILPILLLLLLIPFLALILKVYTGKSIKSPKYHPVAGTLFSLAFHFNRLHDYLGELSKRFHTFRVLYTDHCLIYTNDIHNIEHVFKTKFDNYPKGNYELDLSKDLFGQGIFAVNGVKWRQQRKLASLEFSARVLRDFSCKIFRKRSAQLVRAVSKLSAADRNFDVQDLLMRFALDSIFKVGFGADLNCLQGLSKSATAFISAFDDSNALTFWRYIDPTWKLKKLFNIGSEAALKKNIKIVQDFVDDLIKKKREQLDINGNYNDKEDILTRFLVESEKDPETMNDEYLRDIILNFMIAGKDTTANTLSWFLYMLCKNPLIQEKIAQEVREAVSGQENETKIDDFVQKITDEILEKMHYLHAALTETLRLYPAVPADGRRAEADDILPDGSRVNAGDGVYYSSYAMGRMTYIWGEDAEDFRPERWLNNGIFQPESPFKFVSFHAGPRICLGKDFAYRQMKIVSIALLRFFQFKIADEAKNVTYRTMLTLHIDGGLHLRAIPRPAEIISYP